MSDQVSKLTIPVEVPAELHNAVHNLAKIGIKLYQPLSDGFQIMEDADDLLACAPEVWEVIKGVSGSADGFKEDPFGSTVSILLNAKYAFSEFKRIKEEAEKEGEA